MFEPSRAFSSSSSGPDVGLACKDSCCKNKTISVLSKQISVLNYLAQVLHITRLENVDKTPYDNRIPQVHDILQVLGPDHEVRSKRLSIGTANFTPELTTLQLIMFSNLCPLSNTSFINLGRAQFLCDLITGAPIDICALIFQTIGKTAARSTARACLPFSSLIMKIMIQEGIRPITDGKIVPCLRPIAMFTLQASKSHSSKATKTEPLTHAIPFGHDSATPMHIKTPSTPTLELQRPSTQPFQPSVSADRLNTLIEGIN
ncbi:hypothetical protein SO802_006195 [Lithocarpus litseifolius]|uniref:Uncharacterized protein n=1 Tax=Lithocarpus litseifolius TaxID=425828 RepID=A0AAW2DMR6_9ROSI